MYNSKIINTCNFLSLHASHPENANERLEDLHHILREMIEEQNYDISNKSRSAILDNLDWLETYLDDNHWQYPTYRSEQLLRLWLDVCQDVCEINLLQALNKEDWWIDYCKQFDSHR